MKRIGFRLGISLITFGLGLGAVWGYLPISKPPLIAVEPLPTNETITCPIHRPPSASPAEGVAILLKRSYRNKYGRIIADFEVTNYSDEPLYYTGADKSENRYWHMKRGNQLEHYDSTCATGLLLQTLLPGSSVRLQFVVGDEPGKVQVGFDFSVGEKLIRQTIWSDEVYVSER